MISGFWHGANWTFIIWGALNAFLILPLVLLGKNRDHLDVAANNRHLPSLKEFLKITMTFILINFAWIFFRAKNLDNAFELISKLFSVTIFEIPHWSAFSTTTTHPLIIISLLFFFVLLEWFGRGQQHALNIIALKWPKPLRYTFYYLLILCICFLNGVKQDFIYFQF